jgi:hypothetical protein
MKDPAPTKPKSKKVDVDMTPAWQKYANMILLVVIIGLAVYLLVRYRMDANKAARTAEQQTLTAVRSRIHQLRDAEFNLLSQEMIDTMRDTRYRETDKLITDLLATAKEPNIRAEALIAKGDLNWAIANFPDLPGATTRPDLNPETPKDKMLNVAEAAYNEVLSQYASQPLAASSARIGLAAIAQNRSKFDDAAKLLKAVEDDANAPEAFKKLAKAQREQLKDISQPIYIAPSTQPASDVELLGSTRPTTQPAVTAATTKPTTQPAK